MVEFNPKGTPHERVPSSAARLALATPEVASAALAACSLRATRRSKARGSGMGCPWTGEEVCVVLTQLVREVGYMVLTLWFKLKGCASGKAARAISKPGPKMPLAASKRVCFVRHGQGEHNRSPQYWGLVDSQLNEAGKEQARALHKRLAPDLSDPSLRRGPRALRPERLNKLT